MLTTDRYVISITKDIYTTVQFLDVMKKFRKLG